MFHWQIFYEMILWILYNHDKVITQTLQSSGFQHIKEQKEMKQQQRKKPRFPRLLTIATIFQSPATTK